MPTPGLNVVNDVTNGDGIVGTGDLVGVRGVQGPPVTWEAVCGVLGESVGNGHGVVGYSSKGFGVLGLSDFSFGVYGSSGYSLGVWGEGWTGVHGRGIGTPPSGSYVFGVQGSSDPTNGVGVEGDSESGVGVWGFSRTGIGVRASTDTSHPDRAGWALLTDGDVLIHGTLFAAPGFPKGAVAKLRDGSHRALYCVESPECWFEDFGRARLVRGKARVRLDRTFAAVVRTGDYHVFLSPEGLSHGLYVSRRTRDGFEVREQHRGTNTVPFSYRIVARRRDVDAPRFKRVKLPALPKLLRPLKVKPPKMPGPVRPPQLKTLLGMTRGRKPSVGKPGRARPPR